MMFMGGGFFGLIFIGLLIVFGIYLFNNSRTNHHDTNNSSGDDDALRTLKLRYVNGEISEEEYQKKKEIIERQ